MTSEIEKSPEYIWKEKEAMASMKSVKGIKSPKKAQVKEYVKLQEEFRKSTNDMKIEDVFLNSEYFKHHSGNISSLSFCSGDNGEYHWTIDSKFEIPMRQKSPKNIANESIKSDTAVVEKTKLSKRLQQKIKPPNSTKDEPPEEKTNKLLKGILTGKSRLDRDLITLITEQMFVAERELQITRTHLIETISKLNERDLEILQLHEKIENLQANRKTNSKKGEKQNDITSKTSEDYQRLILASEKLKKQVKDMEEFLNDYGLVWVGEKNLYQKPDFDGIVKSFQKLNAVASEPRIIQTTMGAKFEVPREIPVVLYANGFLLRGSQFRDYNDITAAHFLQDVEDGYFPSELQTEFPDGVPFEVIDKRNEMYTIQSKTPVFQGHGNRLGSSIAPKPSSMVCLEPLKKIRNFESHSSLCCATPKRSLLMKVHKKRPRNCISEDDRSLLATRMDAITAPTVQNTRTADADVHSGPMLKMKVRFGKGGTESFILQMPEQEKMFLFQVLLQRKLCELFHEECLKNGQTNNAETDFEIHVYGRNPFRLSDNVHLFPAECGILNNCVINVTEI